VRARKTLSPSLYEKKQHDRKESSTSLTARSSKNENPIAFRCHIKKKRKTPILLWLRSKNTNRIDFPTPQNFPLFGERLAKCGIFGNSPSPKAKSEENILNTLSFPLPI